MRRILGGLFLLAALAAPSAAQRSSTPPVDLTGKWDFTVTSEGATGEAEVTLIQRGDSLIGKYSHQQLGELQVVGRVDGKAFSFDFNAPFNGQQLPMSIRGTVDGPDALSGTANMGPFGNATFKATRQKTGRASGTRLD